MRSIQYSRIDIGNMTNPKSGAATSYNINTITRTDDYNKIKVTSDVVGAGKERAVSESDMLQILFGDPVGERIYIKEKARVYGDIYENVLAGKLSPIKYYRILKGMDQKTLSRKTGISQPNISRMERVGHEASMELLKKIAKALGISAKDLIIEE